MLIIVYHLPVLHFISSSSSSLASFLINLSAFFMFSDTKSVFSELSPLITDSIKYTKFVKSLN